ncbi:hypothetical protein ACHQM5_027138 [Ranunculus cassubicifolius]
MNTESKSSEMETGSVYYRGFPSTVTRDELLEIFSKAGNVLDILMLDNGYYALHGSVKYSNVKEARYAVEIFNYLDYHGNLIRVVSSELSPVKMPSGWRKVAFENLECGISEEHMLDMFEEYGGAVVSCKRSELNEECGIVEFETEEAAEKAIKGLDGMLINGMPVSITPVIPESEEEEMKREERERTVVVSEFSEKISNLVPYFAQFGVITGMGLTSTNSGYVIFEKIQDAGRAIRQMNGYEHDNKHWVVKWAEPWCEPEKTRKLQNVQDPNLVVKNLQESVSEKYLMEMFGLFGWVESCEVRVDSGEKTGFVAFRKLEEAARAVKSMNGKVIVGKTLSVAFVAISNDEKIAKKAKVAEADGMSA